MGDAIPGRARGHRLTPRRSMPRLRGFRIDTPMGRFPLLSRDWNERLETLVDDLIGDGGVETAFLASILMTAQDSLRKGDHVALSRRIWSANNNLDDPDGDGPPHPPRVRGRLDRRPAL